MSLSTKPAAQGLLLRTIVNILPATLWRSERKVYTSHRLRALWKGPLTSKLARASPEVPQNCTSYS
eukprot:1159060-Pelagomonas_calceolata.AAC.8